VIIGNDHLDARAGENVVDDASRLGCRNGVDLEVAGVGDQRLPERPAASRARQLRPPKLPTTIHTVTVLLNTILGTTRASGLSAPVSVLVSFATVQQGSCWIAMPVVAASRSGLNVDDRPKADLESGLGASPRGFESRILRDSH
jgi:hypothetical protein